MYRQRFQHKAMEEFHGNLEQYIMLWIMHFLIRTFFFFFFKSSLCCGWSENCSKRPHPRLHGQSINLSNCCVFTLISAAPTWDELTLSVSNINVALGVWAPHWLALRFRLPQTGNADSLGSRTPDNNTIHLNDRSQTWGGLDWLCSREHADVLSCGSWRLCRRHQTAQKA